MSTTPDISVIIPAYNEQHTVGQIVTTALQSNIVTEVIVVDDGSTDNTSTIAAHAGATVIRLERNYGKGYALHQGVMQAKNDNLLFLDADLSGLTPEMVTRLGQPVANGDYDMFVALRKKRLAWLNNMLPLLPSLSGIRSLKKTVWYAVPETYKSNFKVELALSYFAKFHQQHVGNAIIPGLVHTIKEKKYGWWRGMFLRFGMLMNIASIFAELYIRHASENMLAKTKSQLKDMR